MSGIGWIGAKHANAYRSSGSKSQAHVSLSGSLMDKFASGQCQENPSCVPAVKFGGVGITGKKSVSQALSSNISIWPQERSYV